MKQPPAPLKILALVTSLALAAGYVVYRVASAKSGDASAAPTTAPVASPDGTTGPSTDRIRVAPRGTVKPGFQGTSGPMMGGSKSLAPLIEPKDLAPAPAPEATPPTAPAPTSPK